jgi:hypothetical protein
MPYTENSGGTVAGRIQNLKPWPKGVSGNPAGRPKNDISAEIARAVFERNPEAIYRAMVRALCKGNARVFQVLADRAYGKVKERIELSASYREPEHLSEGEIDERIRQLEESLGYPPSLPSGDQPR